MGFLTTLKSSSRSLTSAEASHEPPQHQRQPAHSPRDVDDDEAPGKTSSRPPIITPTTTTTTPTTNTKFKSRRSSASSSRRRSSASSRRSSASSSKVHHQHGHHPPGHHHHQGTNQKGKNKITTKQLFQPVLRRSSLSRHFSLSRKWGSFTQSLNTSLHGSSRSITGKKTRKSSEAKHSSKKKTVMMSRNSSRSTGGTKNTRSTFQKQTQNQNQINEMNYSNTAVDVLMDLEYETTQDDPVQQQQQQQYGFEYDEDARTEGSSEGYTEDDDEDGQDLERAIVRLDGIEVYAVISALTCATSISCFDNFQPTPWSEILVNRAVFTFVSELCYYGCSSVGMLTGLHATLIFSLVTMYGRTALGVDRDDAFNDFFGNTGGQRYSGFRSFRMSLYCFMTQLCFLIEKKVSLAPLRPMVLVGTGYVAYTHMYQDSERVATAAGVIYAPPPPAAVAVALAPPTPPNLRKPPRPPQPQLPPPTPANIVAASVLSTTTIGPCQEDEDKKTEGGATTTRRSRHGSDQKRGSFGTDTNTITIPLKDSASGSGSGGIQRHGSYPRRGSLDAVDDDHDDIIIIPLNDSFRDGMLQRHGSYQRRTSVGSDTNSVGSASPARGGGGSTHNRIMPRRGSAGSSTSVSSSHDNKNSSPDGGGGGGRKPQRRSSVQHKRRSISLSNVALTTTTASLRKLPPDD